jgi:LytTr DNA-binding domain
MKVWDIWKQKHPGYEDLRIYWRTITLIALLIFFILALLQPFGIAQNQNETLQTLKVAFIYALCAFLTMLVSTCWIVYFPRVFEEKNWTLGKEIIMIAYQMSSVAFAVWLLNQFRMGISPTLTSYLRTLVMVTAAGILPYTVVTLFRHVYLLKTNLREAQNISLTESLYNQPGMLPSGFIQLENLDVPLLVNEFLFAESKGNYLEIYTLKHGLLQKYTVRGSLKQFQDNNQSVSGLFRSHRAFILNLHSIVIIEGNAAGYQVQFHPEAPEVPVSRSKIDDFKEAMKRLK